MDNVKKVRRHCEDEMVETLSDLPQRLDFTVRVLGKTWTRAPNFMFIMFVRKREIELSPLQK